MIKRILLVNILFFSMFFALSLKGYSTTDYPDPFSYYSISNSSHYLYTSYYMEIPDPAPDYLYLYMPKTNYYKSSITVGGSTYRSYIEFYNTNFLSTTKFYLDDLDFTNEYEGDFDGLIWIDLLATIPKFQDGYAYFSIYLAQDYADRPTAEYLEWFNDRFNFIFDSEEIEGYDGGTGSLTYRVDDYDYYTVEYDVGTIPDRPVDPHKDSLVFRGWKDENGNIYNFTNGFVFNPLPRVLTASWIFPYNDIPSNTGTTPDIASTILGYVGMNNTFGKIIVYFLFMIVISVVLLFWKLQTFVILIVNALWFAVAIFMGWLPMYVILVLSLTFAIGIFKSITGGV